jgi:hypothetical protein
VSATAIAIVERLIVQAELTGTGTCGRILYTNNWCTSIDLALVLYQKYGWRFCGTVAPTNEVVRQDMDVPFVKLSNGAMKTIPRGWYQEAVLQMRVGRKEFYVQANVYSYNKYWFKPKETYCSKKAGEVMEVEVSCATFQA